MHVHEWGDGGDPVVLCLHKTGAAAGGLQFEITGRALADRYRLHVLAPDAPGYGSSDALPPERYRLPALARLWLGVLDARGVERAAVIGSSWGGAVACHLAAAAPSRVTGLVLLDSGHFTYTQYAPPNPTLEAVAAMVAETRAEGPVPTAVLAAVIHALARDPVDATWPALRDLPVLLLVAGREPEERAFDREGLFAAALPQAEVRVLEEWPHDMPAHDGDELADMLGPWLRARS